MDRKHTAYFVLYQPSSNNCAAVVSYMASYFKQNKAYFTNTKDLSIGDLVFFQNSDGLSHVGLCVDWDSSYFYTVEGNKDNQVKKCAYRYGEVGGYVAGFASPRYTDDCSRADAVAYALSQVGYKEGANNWNKYAAQLDEVDYFEGCGKKQNLPWCAVFICAVMYNAYKEDPTPPSPTPTPTGKEYKVKTNTGDALRLRAEPTTDSKQVGYINNGEIIVVDEVVKGEDIGGVDTWVLTKYGTFYDGLSQGYASGKYLDPTPEITPSPEPTPQPEPQPDYKEYRVKTTTGVALRIREKPTTDSKQIGYIDDGKICKVYSIFNGWANVEYKGVKGYSYARYLKEV